MSNIIKFKSQLTKFSDKDWETVDNIALEIFTLKAVEDKHPISAFLGMAERLNFVRDFYNWPEVKPILLGLKGLKVGFLTDKDKSNKGSYNETEIINALVEGLFQGAKPWGNEINIIAGHCYLAKNFYLRMLAEDPRLKDHSFKIGIPENIGSTGTSTEVEIMWNFGRKEMVEKLTITAKRDGFSTVDAIKGKVERKAAKWLFERIGGHRTDDGEVIDIQKTGNNEVPKSLGNSLDAHTVPVGSKVKITGLEKSEDDKIVEQAMNDIKEAEDSNAVFDNYNNEPSEKKDPLNQEAPELLKVDGQFKFP